MDLHSLDINNMNSFTYFSYQDHRTNTSELFGNNLWQNNKVISTYWSKLNHKSVFIVVSSILLVMTYKLLSVLFLAKYIVFYEISKSLSMRSVLKVEVKTLSKVFLSNVNYFFSCIVLQNHLFKEQKGSLMIYLLSHLNLTLP